MKKIDLNFYPGFKRKAISFTIDDGNLKLDEKFISYVKPAGIRGTFNLVSNYIREDNKERYRELYRDYEIANHMKYHPMAFDDGKELVFTEEAYVPETADKSLVYKTDIEGLFYVSKFDRWFRAADNENYIRLVREGKRELEEIFGKTVRDFVWPYGKQRNCELYELMKKEGYRSIRGSVYDGFSLPKDRSNWGFYATYQNMTERAAAFDALSDDGELKAFIFGVHSHDFANADRWDVLEDFCKKYGNRSEDFYYATVGEIFDREDAIKSVLIEDGIVNNPSSLPIYALVDGEERIIPPKSVYNSMTDSFS